MAFTLIEKIIASHSKQKNVKPGDIIDIEIDCRAARDFGGANVIKNIVENGLQVDDPKKTFFTFDCNPGGSDQKYAQNQHYCRQFAQEKGITVLDINNGIGTHSSIDSGLACPGSTFVSTDSHANIMGAIGCFGQGMGDQDIAAAWANGFIWFKVPHSIKITLTGVKKTEISAKDIILNLLKIFGANSLLGYSVELYGAEVDKLTLDERITISSMATEMGAIIIFFTPTENIINELKAITGREYQIECADDDAKYEKEYTINIESFEQLVALPGHPHNNVPVADVTGTKIDSAFIGSCTNGRLEDLRKVAKILKDKKVAKGVILKIVPATDKIWKQALEEGLIAIFKNAGALVSNAGCAGCAEGQIGQNGNEEVTLSTGNRNFAGKQGKGLVYLASPETVAASAVAGYIVRANDSNSSPVITPKTKKFDSVITFTKKKMEEKPTVITGRAWIIEKDNIDTDMIFHNKYLTITNIEEMGKYTFDNLAGFENFAKEASPNDIIITKKNFGAGSSRQQAVDCFIALKTAAILAESYGAIYERNAINAAFPVLTYSPKIFDITEIKNGDNISVNFITGEVINLSNNKKFYANPFYDAQFEIYKKGGLLK